MSRSKDIGTAAETKLVRWFQANGYPNAKRITLHGSKDIGDVSLGDGIPLVVEVKAGRAAETASDGQMRMWLEELLTEQLNATQASGKEHYGVLIVKRAGHGDTKIGGWWALTNYGSAQVVRWRLDEWLDQHRPIIEGLTREQIRNSWDDDDGQPYPRRGW